MVGRAIALYGKFGGGCQRLVEKVYGKNTGFTMYGGVVANIFGW